VPVISTDAGGSRDTFVEGETGYLALDPSVDKIAELLLRCIDNPNWMAAAKSKSREQARKRFSQSAMIERLKEIYSLALQRT
jgi:glycosyltransferase involved in cell wall biosynthesis